MISASLLLAALLPGAVVPSHSDRPLIPIDEPVLAATAAPVAPARVGRPATSDASQSIANQRVNDPTQLPAGAVDYTPAIAANGDQVLIVWRVVGSLPTERLRAAYSENGGASFADAGWLPALPGNWRWGPDPCVEVDPIDGTFMVLAQVADPAIPATGVAVITAHIGGGIAWNAPGNFPYVTGSVGAYFGESLDAHFDATNRTLHMAFSDNYVIPTTLVHRYSADHGATWFPTDVIVSDPSTTTGNAPRVAFNGGTGPLVTHIGGDYWQPQTITASRFEWPSFQPGVTVDTHLTTELSLPGSLYDRITNPSLAVDRTIYRFSGRAYEAWVQSAALAPWPAPAAGVQGETEPDDTPATAISVGPGFGHVAAAMTSGADVDVFSVSLLAQQHLVIVPESLGAAGSTPNLRFEFLAADGTHSLGYAVVTTNDLGVARLLFTAPRAATYFLRVTNFNVGTYQFSVATSSLTSYPAADRRDIVVSRSDTRGATWSAPAPVYTSLPGFDVGLLKIVVGNDGRPYLFWMDYSGTDPDGAVAALRTTRSNDGGVTWEAPRTISTVATDWQAVTALGGSGTKFGYRIDAATTPIELGEMAAPMAPARTRQAGTASPSEGMHVTWVDGRDGDGNIYEAHFPTGFEVLYVCNDTVAVPGQWVGLRMVLQNRNTLFPAAITPSFLACQRNWSSIMAPFSLDAGETRSFWPVVVQIPDTAAAGTVFYQAAIDLGPETYGLNTFIHVQTSTGVGAGSPAAVAFAAPAPNPARGATDLGFTLPASERVSLQVYDVHGARVRTLQAGVLPAGAHTRTWRLDDDAGRAVPAGLYLARLEAGDARHVRRIAVVR